MKLSSHQWRYLLVAQSLLPVMINVLICGAIDYRHLDILPMWGFPKGMALDLLGTSFLLPMITWAIATLLVWPASLFGVSGLVLVGSAALIVLRPLPVVGTNASTFLIGKPTFAGIDGAIVTPLIALVAMTDELSPVFPDRTESTEKPTA